MLTRRSDMFTPENSLVLTFHRNNIYKYLLKLLYCSFASCLILERPIDVKFDIPSGLISNWQVLTSNNILCSLKYLMALKLSFDKPTLTCSPDRVTCQNNFTRIPMNL